jgi:hypothetical protein
MPYQFSHQWRTPFEVERAQMGDCKGKALLLYGWMRSKGATKMRLVIGKRRPEDLLTHAWLEWDTQIGTFLLDPTFNWTAAPKTQDQQNYVAFYGYGSGRKYRAANSLLANRTFAARNPAAPAHGVIARPGQSTWQSYSNSRPLYENTNDPRLFANRMPLKRSTSTQSQMDYFRGRVYAQREPIADAIRYNQFAGTALVKAGPISEQRRAESESLVQHQLAAVSVTGERQRHLSLSRRVERMRVMREQNRKRTCASLAK